MVNRMREIFSWGGFRWAAVTILLSAYVLVSQGWVSGEGLTFNLLNASGSVLMILNSISMKPRDWAVAVFNIVWLVIGVYTVLRMI